MNRQVALSDAGWRGLVADWSSDRRAFGVSWGKAMMWIFPLSDTFIFGSFLTGYMVVRMSTTGDVAALTSFRFARVLARAMPSVSILGRIGYHRLATAVPEAEEVGDGEMT